MTEIATPDVNERFFFAFERRFAPLEAVRTPTTPPEMVCGEVADSPGWVYWRLYPWQPAYDVLAELEQRVGLPFPDSFKSLFTCLRTLNLDLGLVRFPETPLRHELDRLRTLLLEDEYSPRAIMSALLPFGWDGRDDYGLLCFDRRGKKDGGEPPIVCLRAFDGSFRIEPVASSFSVYRDACIFFLECETDFLGLAEQSAVDEDLRHSLFEDFLAIDSDGMAAAGRDYWANLANLERGV